MNMTIRSADSVAVVYTSLYKRRNISLIFPMLIATTFKTASLLSLKGTTKIVYIIDNSINAINE